jgi:hypothetical protein
MDSSGCVFNSATNRIQHCLIPRVVLKFKKTETETSEFAKYRGIKEKYVQLPNSNVLTGKEKKKNFITLSFRAALSSGIILIFVSTVATFRCVPVQSDHSISINCNEISKSDITEQLRVYY